MSSENEKEAEDTNIYYGVWYVMKKNWGGWELYKPSPEVVARCFENSETPGRVRYEVFGIDARAPMICEIEAFKSNVVRKANEQDAKTGPRTPLV